MILLGKDSLFFQDHLLLEVVRIMLFGWVYILYYIILLWL
jgi:hypothetical protein